MTTATLCVLLSVSRAGAAPGSRSGRLPASRSSVGCRDSAADGSVAVGDKTVAGGEWYSVRRADAALPPWPRAPHVELTNGDRLVGTVNEADGDALRLARGFPGEADKLVRFPLSALRAVWLTPPAGRRPGPRLADGPPQARPVPGSQRRLGDRGADGHRPGPQRGPVPGRRQGPTRWNSTKLAAVGFNTDLARVRRPKGPYYRLTLADGSRLSVQSVTFDGRVWDGRHRCSRTRFASPPTRSCRSTWNRGGWRGCRTMKPAKYQYMTATANSFRGSPTGV